MISLVNPLYDFIQLMVKQIKKANADVIISGKAILFDPHLQKLPLILPFRAEFVHNKKWNKQGNHRQITNRRLEHTELLTDVGETLRLLRLMTDHVESHSLGQRSRHQNNQQHKPALTNSHDISFLHVKTRRAVSGNVTMSLLITTIHYYFKSPTVCTSSRNAGSHDAQWSYAPSWWKWPVPSE